MLLFFNTVWNWSFSKGDAQIKQACAIEGFHDKNRVFESAVNLWRHDQGQGWLHGKNITSWRTNPKALDKSSYKEIPVKKNGNSQLE